MLHAKFKLQFLFHSWVTLPSVLCLVLMFFAPTAFGQSEPLPTITRTCDSIVVADPTAEDDCKEGWLVPASEVGTTPPPPQQGYKDDSVQSQPLFVTEGDYIYWLIRVRNSTTFDLVNLTVEDTVYGNLVIQQLVNGSPIDSIELPPSAELDGVSGTVFDGFIDGNTNGSRDDILAIRLPPPAATGTFSGDGYHTVFQLDETEYYAIWHAKRASEGYASILCFDENGVVCPGYPQLFTANGGQRVVTDASNEEYMIVADKLYYAVTLEDGTFGMACWDVLTESECTFRQYGTAAGSGAALGADILVKGPWIIGNELYSVDWFGDLFCQEAATDVACRTSVNPGGTAPADFLVADLSASLGMGSGIGGGAVGAGEDFTSDIGQVYDDRIYKTRKLADLTVIHYCLDPHEVDMNGDGPLCDDWNGVTTAAAHVGDLALSTAFFLYDVNRRPTHFCSGYGSTTTTDGTLQLQDCVDFDTGDNPQSLQATNPALWTAIASLFARSIGKEQYAGYINRTYFTAWLPNRDIDGVICWDWDINDFCPNFNVGGGVDPDLGPAISPPGTGYIHTGQTTNDYAIEPIVPGCWSVYGHENIIYTFDDQGNSPCDFEEVLAAEGAYSALGFFCDSGSEDLLGNWDFFTIVDDSPDGRVNYEDVRTLMVNVYSDEARTRLLGSYPLKNVTDTTLSGPIGDIPLHYATSIDEPVASIGEPIPMSRYPTLYWTVVSQVEPTSTTFDGTLNERMFFTFENVKPLELCFLTQVEETGACDGSVVVSNEIAFRANIDTPAGIFPVETIAQGNGFYVLPQAGCEADLSLVKSADMSSARVGDTLTYTVDVYNDGPTPTFGVDVTDLVPDGLDIQSATISNGGVENPNPLIDWQDLDIPVAPVSGGVPAVSLTYETVVNNSLLDTQTDVVNLAQVADTPFSTDPNSVDNDCAAGDGASQDDCDEFTVTVYGGDPQLELVKSANPAAGAHVGDTVTWTIMLRNTGTGPASNITISDAYSSNSFGSNVDVSGRLTCFYDDGTVFMNDGTEILFPGENVTCTVVTTVAPGDVPGDLQNVATVTAGNPNDPANPPTTPPATSVVSTEEAPPEGGLHLAKNVTGSDATPAVAGTTIFYDLIVTNTSAFAVADVTIVDQVGGVNIAAPCGPAYLLPGETLTCTASYALTQADIDNGNFSNVGEASGIPDRDGDGTGDAGETPITDQDNATVSPGGNGTSGSPAIDMSKSYGGLAPSGDLDGSGGLTPGDQVLYNFTIINTGNVALSGVTFSDPGLDPGTETCTALIPEPLDVFESVSCTGLRTVTLADIQANNSNISNTATVTGTDPDGEDVTDIETLVVTPFGPPVLRLTKAANPMANVREGDTVTWTIILANVGGGPATNVSIGDDFTSNSVGTDVDISSGLDCAYGDGTTFNNDGTEILNAGDTVTCTSVYTVVSADVPGDLVNMASVTATDPTDPTNPPLTPESEVTVQTEEDPVAGSIQLTKTITSIVPGPAVVGSVVTYSLEATNTSGTGLDNVVINDTVGGINIAAPCGPVYLDPGDSLSCSASYTVTQADVDAGVHNNTAVTFADAPDDTPGGTGTVVVSDTDSAAFTPAGPGVPDSPALDMSKSYGGLANDLDGSGNVTPGDTITYNFIIANTGNVDLANVSFDDPTLDAGTETCSAAIPNPLPAGTSVTCMGERTVTAADFAANAGIFSNTATVTGENGNDPTETVTDSETTVVQADDEPELILAKSANPASNAQAGDTVTFTVVLTNNGDGTATNTSVSDSFTDGSGNVTDITNDLVCAYDDGMPYNNDGTEPLTPGQSAICTYLYTVTPADVPSVLTNSATGSGSNPSDPSGPPIQTVDEIDVPTEDPGPNALTLTKSVARADATPVVEGTTIFYGLVATNTSPQPISDVSIADTVGGVSVIAPCGPVTLNPGESLTCSASYTLTAGDILAGGFNNVATATGTDFNGQPVQDTDNATVTPEGPGVPASPAVDMSKAYAGFAPGGDVNSDGLAVAGDTILYAFVITNTGNVDLVNGTFSDPTLDPGTETCSAAFPNPLQVLDSFTCTGERTLTLADFEDHGGDIPNTATITATSASDPSTEVTDSETIFVTPLGTPDLVLTKTANPAGNVQAGDTVAWTITLTNRGDGLATNVSITDEFTSNSAGNDVSLSNALACRYVDGTVFTNDGTESLNPGDTVTCLYQYEVQEADIPDALINAVSAQGEDPTDPSNPITIPEVETVVETEDTPEQGGLSFTKRVTSADIVPLVVGSTIQYELVSTNASPDTITGVTIVDSVGGVSIDAPCGPVDLAPGENLTCSASYTLTQADIDAGTFSNVALSTGTDPDGNPVVDSDSATVTPPGPGGPRTPAVDLAKFFEGFAPGGDADNSGTITLGDTIRYRMSVVNTGNMDVENITVTDVFSVAGTTHDVSSDIDCDGTGSNVIPGPLSPLESANCVVDVPVDATVFDDLVVANSGQLSNDATVTAQPIDETGTPVGEPIVDTETVTVDATSAPELELTKSANPGGMVQPGDTISWTVSVENIGNGPATNVVIDDTFTSTTDPAATLTPQPPAGCEIISGPTVDIVGGPVPWTNGGVLAPGDRVSCVSIYTVSNSDVDPDTGMGSLSNALAVTSVNPFDPTDPVVPDPVEIVVSTEDPSNPNVGDDIMLSKIAVGADSTPLAVGSVVTYRLIATNISRDPLSDVQIDDPQLDSLVVVNVGADTSVAGSACTGFTLQPGENLVCEGQHTITQADLDAGAFTNVATASATTQEGDPTNGSDTATVTTHDDGELVPGIDLSKTYEGILIDADGNDIVTLGDTLAYTFIVANTGNTDLANVAVNDVFGVGDTTIAVDPSSIDCGGTGGNVIAGPIGPLESLTCFAAIEFTEDMLPVLEESNGQLPNVGSATGTPVDATGTPISEPVTDYETVSPDAEEPPVIGLAKQLVEVVADPAVPNSFDLTFQFLVEALNGVTPINNIQITDDLGAVFGDDLASVTVLAGPSTTGLLAANPGYNGVSDVNLLDGMGTLLPGQSETVSVTVKIFLQPTIEAGTYQNTAVSTGTSPGGQETTDVSNNGDQTDPDGDGNPDEPDENTTTTVLLEYPDLFARMTKTTEDRAFQVGELVPFALTAENLLDQSYVMDIVDFMPPGFNYQPGTAYVANPLGSQPVQVEPMMEGTKLTWPGIVIAPGSTVQVTLFLKASIGVDPGVYINYTCTEAGEGENERCVSNLAPVSVEIAIDPLFDCATVTGQVFYDKNRDGYQDPGEHGVPGVRIGSVEGFFIYPDDHGRYHVPCATLPSEIGSNYILKVDPSTIPLGYGFTTENPRVRRLTKGKMSRIDFGIWKKCVVEVDLTEEAFVGNTTQLYSEWQPYFADLFNALGQEANAECILQTRIKACGTENSALNIQRANMISRYLAGQWQAISNRDIDTSVAVLSSVGELCQVDHVLVPHTMLSSLPAGSVEVDPRTLNSGTGVGRVEVPAGYHVYRTPTDNLVFVPGDAVGHKPTNQRFGTFDLDGSTAFGDDATRQTPLPHTYVTLSDGRRVAIPR